MSEHLAVILAILGIFLTALAQILLKKGAVRARNRHFFLTWFHPFAICGYALLGIVTLCNLAAFRVLPLKTGVILLPWTFVLITVFSRLFLGERMRREQLAAALLILAGLVIFVL